MKKKITFLGSALLIIVLIFLLSEKVVKIDMKICSYCHIDGKKIHKEKYKSYENASVEKNDLSSLHYGKKEFHCFDCHRGTDLKGEVEVFSLKILNSFKYFSGLYEKPKKLKHTFTDENCLTCHKRNDFKSSSPFHNKNAHMGKLKTTCIDCHSAHKSAGIEETYFMDKEKVMNSCKTCHPRMEGVFKDLFDRSFSI